MNILTMQEAINSILLAFVCYNLLMRSDMRKKLPSALFYILFITFTALFIYFRIGSVIYKTVGYTYDQGRDFLKVSEIILQKNITFIGPTTGIEGLFHGAWYYYILTIPFIIFNAILRTVG